jgi:hypothetical protein
VWQMECECGLLTFVGGRSDHHSLHTDVGVGTPPFPALFFTEVFTERASSRLTASTSRCEGPVEEEKPLLPLFWLRGRGAVKGVPWQGRLE